MLGYEPSDFQIYYMRVGLPQAGDIFRGQKVKKVIVTAMSDGIKRHTAMEERIDALSKAGNCQEAANSQVALADQADADDRIAITSQTRFSV